MLVIDAVHTFEFVFAIWLWMSAIAFILLGIFGANRESVAAADETAKSDRSAPKLDLVAKTEKKPVSVKTPAHKAA
jgi:hypothetical protein